MITKTIELYQYDELTHEAKEKAMNWWLKASIGDEWWECIYDDAKQIGLKITSFDCGRANDIQGLLLKDAEDVCQLIINNHGEACESYKLAVKYNQKYREYPIDEEKGTWWEDEREKLSNSFTKELLEDYLDTLKKEYEYINSKEVIEENIRVNEYTFLSDGTRFD